MMSDKTGQTNELTRAVARIQAAVLAIVCALIGGLVLFLMTIWLVIKGGDEVGPHLSLLNQYFPGYSVTWTGSIVGFFYGALVGGIIGWTIAFIYNRIISLR